MNKPKIYIISTGRAGTTFLYKFFEKHYPEFNITHQTRWSRLINIIGNLPLNKQLKNYLLRQMFRLLKKQKLPFTTLDPLLSIPITDLMLQKTHDKVKIIHLVRHPQSFANSFMAWKSSSLSKFILHYLIPFWQPVALFNGITFFKWIKMSKYDKFCWIWNFKNQKFLSLQNKYDYKRFKMEELTKNDSHDLWLELLTFIELPNKKIDYKAFVSEKVNKSNIVTIQKPQQLQEQQTLQCKFYCQSLAKDLDYLI